MAGAALTLGRARQADYSAATRWIVLVALMLGTILEVLDTSIVNVALSDMMGNLGATLGEISWVVTGYTVANVIVLPITGWLSARFGRRRYLTASIVLFTAASFFCGTARTLPALVLFRILQGAGGAALLSTAQATIQEIFPAEQQGVVTGIFGIGVMVGPTLGPTLGGWLIDAYSWPWIFFINIPIGIVAAILTALFLRDAAQQPGSRKIDVPGVALLALGLGSLQTLLEEGNREDWFESSFIRWLSVLALAGLALFIAWELRASQPIVNLRVLKNRGLSAGVAFGAVLAFGLYGGVCILPIFLQQVRGYTAEQTGWILFPGGIATALMMPVVGKLVGRFPARNLVALGAVGFAATMWMLRDLTTDSGPQQIFWPYVLRGVAISFLYIPLSLSALAGLNGKDLADGSGLFNLARQLGGSIGIALLSTFVEKRADFHRAKLVEYVTAYSPFAQERLASLKAAMLAHVSDPPIAAKQALAIVDRAVQLQAAILSYEDVFVLMAAAFLLALPLLLLFKKGAATGAAGTSAH